MGVGEGVMGARRYKLAVIIYVSPRDGMDSMVIVVNNTVLHI